MTESTPRIDFYTDHACPWAHRVHITLSVLGLPFTEHIVDLSVPRTAEYLAINPRGIVPSMIYNGENIRESAIITQFLVDSHPSHLVKTSSEPGGALARARINFFVDAFMSKVGAIFFGTIRAPTEEARVEGAAKMVDAIVAELEPLLKDANPFFGGAEKITLAEALTGPFVLRIMSFPKHDLMVPNLLTDIKAKAPAFSKWASAVMEDKYITCVWDEQVAIRNAKVRLAKYAAEAKAKTT